MKRKIAVYPGSFDPITNGHLDLIQRALKIFDHIVVAVATNAFKKSLFTIEERMEMIRGSLVDHPNVSIDSFDGLLVKYAKARKARAILRGLRAVTDFEYEFQLAMMNRRLEPEIETVFLMTGLRWVFLSSSILKEAALHGGDIEGMVPEIVFQKLREKFEMLRKA
ncbi:MAG: pantetheine-phosphate adenylyltransferase [Deltaproteobacteria bacterium]|nr:pantetheine-phosphate adenylyltransferase [Deltaproteobacteria bacterium]